MFSLKNCAKREKMKEQQRTTESRETIENNRESRETTERQQKKTAG